MATAKKREQTQATPIGDLNEVAQLARLLVDYERKVDDAEEALKQAKEDARRIREEALPSAMNELGLREVRLQTGEKISVSLEVYASIPVAKKAEAFEWLETNGFGALIKTEVFVQFGRDKREEATKLAAQLRDSGLMADSSMSVAPQTLKAFLKEQIGNGSAIPLELFGARPVDTAKVKR